MLFHSRNLVPWITGILAIGGLVTMSMMEVPDTRLALSPTPQAATAPEGDSPDAAAAEAEVEYCADGATKSYSDRPCESRDQLQLIPFSLTPPTSPPR